MAPTGLIYRPATVADNARFLLLYAARAASPLEGAEYERLRREPCRTIQAALVAGMDYADRYGVPFAGDAVLLAQEAVARQLGACGLQAFDGGASILRAFLRLSMTQPADPAHSYSVLVAARELIRIA